MLLLVRNDPHPKDTILSVRISAEMDERLKKAAEALDLSKNDVARSALRSALDAMEARRYRIEWPLRMEAGPGRTRAEKEEDRAILEDIKMQVSEILRKQRRRSVGRRADG